MLKAIKERIQDGERLLDPTRAKDTFVAEMISWIESFSAYLARQRLAVGASGRRPDPPRAGAARAAHPAAGADPAPGI